MRTLFNHMLTLMLLAVVGGIFAPSLLASDSVAVIANRSVPEQELNKTKTAGHLHRRCEEMERRQTGRGN